MHAQESQQMLERIMELSEICEKQMSGLKAAYHERISKVKENGELSLAEKERMVVVILGNFSNDYKQLHGTLKKQAKEIIEKTIPGPDHKRIRETIERSNKNILTRPIPDFLARTLLELDGSAKEKLAEWKAFKKACTLFTFKSPEEAECELLEDFIQWRETKEKARHATHAPEFLVKKLGTKDAAKAWAKILSKVNAFDSQIEELRGICKLKIEKARTLEDHGERKEKLKRNLNRLDSECRKACAKFVRSLQHDIKETIPAASPVDVRKTIHHLNRHGLARWLPDAGIKWMLKKWGHVRKKYVEIMTFAAASSHYKPKKLEHLKKELIQELVKEKVLEEK